MRRGPRHPVIHPFTALLASLALVIMSGALHTANARGGVSQGVPWIEIDAAYLHRFPAEVRSSIEAQKKLCGATAAVQQSFARYIHVGGAQHDFITLHFDRLRCADRSLICGPEGCLHQVYAPAGASYRLVFSGRVGDVELAVVNGHAAVRIECPGASERRCPRVLLWNGERLVEGD